MNGSSIAVGRALPVIVVLSIASGCGESDVELRSGGLEPRPEQADAGSSEPQLARCPDLWPDWEEFRAVNTLLTHGIGPYEGSAQVVTSSPARLELLVEGAPFVVENDGQLLPLVEDGQFLELRMLTVDSLSDSSHVVEIRDATGAVLLLIVRHLFEEFRAAIRRAIDVDVSVAPLCDATNSECQPRTMLSVRFDEQLELEPFQAGYIEDAAQREFYVSLYYAGDTLYRWDDDCQTASQVPSGPYIGAFLVAAQR